MDRNYAAFISYRHRKFDKDIARKLQKRLEQYVIPRSLRKSGEKTIGYVFRDQDELPASNDLSENIRNALDHSQFMIVICTPDTPDSIWVEREIKYFLQNHERDHLLAVLAAGDSKSSFPTPLTHINDENDTVVEPLAANICADTEVKSLMLLRRESLRLLSAILGCSYDDLVKREQKRKRQNRLKTSLVFLTFVLIVVGVIEFNNQRLKQQEAAARKAQIEASQLFESQGLTHEANTAIEKNDFNTAIKKCIAALPSSEGDRPYYAPAEAALFSGLHVFQNEARLNIITSEIQTDQSVLAFQPTSDGKKIIVYDAFYNVSAYDPVTGKMIWRSDFTNNSEPREQDAKPNLIVSETNRQIYALCGKSIAAYNIDTGIRQWETDPEKGVVAFWCSPDESMIVALQRYDQSLHLDIYASADGSRTGSIGIDSTFNSMQAYNRLNGFLYDIPLEDMQFQKSAVISNDNSSMAGIFCDEDQRIYCIADFANERIDIKYSEPKDPASHLLWMEYFIQEETNHHLITIFSQGSSTIDGITARVIDMTDGKEISKSITVPQSRKIEASIDSPYHVLRWGKDELLISADRELYAFDPFTGKIINHVEMPGSVTGLFQEPGNILFGYTLDDGTYSLGFIADGTFLSADNIWPNGYKASLGKTSLCLSGNQGFIKASFDENLSFSYISSDNNSFIASMSPESGRSIFVHRLQTFGLLFESAKKEVAAPGIRYNVMNSFSLQRPISMYVPMRFNTDGTLLYYDGFGNQWVNLELKGGEVLETYDCSSETVRDEVININNAFPIVGKNKVIFTGAYGDVLAYDTVSNQFDVLQNRKRNENSQISDFEAFLQGYDSGRLFLSRASSSWLNNSDSVLTAYCDDERVIWWRDGSTPQEAVVPYALQQKGHSGSIVISWLQVSPCGMIIIGFDAIDDSGSSSSWLTAYDTESRKWWDISAEIEPSDLRHVTSGYCSAAVVLVKESTIEIYQNTFSAPQLCIELDPSHNYVADCQFILDDQYIATCTAGGDIQIFDLNGFCVFTGSLGNTYQNCQEIAADADLLNNRLYICEQETNKGLCIDLTSWIELSKIEDVYMFNSISGELLMQKSNDSLILYKVPSLEQLINIGKQFVY